ncbi:methyltransferase domain-containing protein [Phytohabitans sp. LJ34]|uniref:methyltransferase domain-containing protein n=1 Tax=Phytohabitans sp. LJ34 TaxID=3452217 RepID=UPI003F88F417
MMDFTAVPAAPDHVEYLDAAAATAAGRGYKRRFLEALDVRPGQVVLDVGCGPGTDLVRLSGAVGEAGSVVGVDRDPAMVEHARRRASGHRNVEVRRGDVHALPCADACADRVRTDRVLQHVEDPARAVAELRRVLRPGGLAGMAELDWDTLAVDDSDVETSRAVSRFMAGRVRNAVVGRQLPRLAAAAGLAVFDVDASVVVFRDFGTADQVLGLRRNVIRAVQAGVLGQRAAEDWAHRTVSGPFLATLTLFTVVAGV